MRGEESSDSESGRMEESSVRRSLEVLCQELNMDEQTASEAMENFSSIWNTYTLEVTGSARFADCLSPREALKAARLKRWVCVRCPIVITGMLKCFHGENRRF